MSVEDDVRRITETLDVLFWAKTPRAFERARAMWNAPRWARDPQIIGSLFDAARRGLAEEAGAEEAGIAAGRAVAASYVAAVSSVEDFERRFGERPRLWPFCPDCGAEPGAGHGQADYGRCDGYELVRDRRGRLRFAVPVGEEE